MNLLKILFPKAAELAEARSRIEQLEADKDDLKRKEAALWESYNRHDATVQSQRSEIANLKAKLREQNDADLLAVSARIAIKILKGEKPAASELALQQNLIQQQRAYGQAYEYAVGPYGSGGLLNQLGLRGIFG